MIWDAVIAGAGPAGAVAAHVLARHGRKVLLVDTAPKHAIKVGEALPAAALRLLRALGIRITCDSTAYVPIGGNLFCWDSEELSGTDFFRDPDGPGWRLERLRFDFELREAAKSSGATFEHVRVINASQEGVVWHYPIWWTSARSRAVADQCRGQRLFSCAWPGGEMAARFFTDCALWHWAPGETIVFEPYSDRSRGRRMVVCWAAAVGLGNGRAASSSTRCGPSRYLSRSLARRIRGNSPYQCSIPQIEIRVSIARVGCVGRAVEPVRR